jgi:hypothetical protein
MVGQKDVAPLAMCKLYTPWRSNVKLHAFIAALLPERAGRAQGEMAALLKAGPRVLWISEDNAYYNVISVQFLFINRRQAQRKRRVQP